MKRLIFLLILPLIMGCISYTPRERSAINAYHRGDPHAFSSLTPEELDILEAKLLKEQAWVRAFTSGSKSYSQSSVNSLYSLQNAWDKQAEQRKQDQALDYQKRQAEALEEQNHYQKYGW